MHTEAAPWALEPLPLSKRSSENSVKACGLGVNYVPTPWLHSHDLRTLTKSKTDCKITSFRF